LHSKEQHRQPRLAAAQARARDPDVAQRTEGVAGLSVAAQPSLRGGWPDMPQGRDSGPAGIRLLGKGKRGGPSTTGPWRRPGRPGERSLLGSRDGPAELRRTPAHPDQNAPAQPVTKETGPAEIRPLLAQPGLRATAQAGIGPAAASAGRE
jgi:hypothetical protein